MHCILIRKLNFSMTSNNEKSLQIENNAKMFKQLTTPHKMSIFFAQKAQVSHKKQNRFFAIKKI